MRLHTGSDGSEGGWLYMSAETSSNSLLCFPEWKLSVLHNEFPQAEGESIRTVAGTNGLHSNNGQNFHLPCYHLHREFRESRPPMRPEELAFNS